MQQKQQQSRCQKRRVTCYVNHCAKCFGCANFRLSLTLRAAELLQFLALSIGTIKCRVYSRAHVAIESNVIEKLFPVGKRKKNRFRLRTKLSVDDEVAATSRSRLCLINCSSVEKVFCRNNRIKSLNSECSIAQ